MRIREPKTTALIFGSGKMVCTGAKSEQESKLAAKKVRMGSFCCRGVPVRLCVGSCCAGASYPQRLCVHVCAYSFRRHVSLGYLLQPWGVQLTCTCVFHNHLDNTGAAKQRQLS